MSKYAIEMELSGPLAMWARPDTGTSPSSYPIPTWSAAKGIFESIAFFKDGRAWINPVRVEICKPAGQQHDSGEVRYQKYMTNYGGPLRESGLISKNNNYQFAALVVANPCYRLFANIESDLSQKPKQGENPAHALQAIFKRRLKKGQSYHTPFLGWSEFVPDYWGTPRDSIEVDTAITLNLISFLKGMYDKPLNGQTKPKFYAGNDAFIKEGVFYYA